MKKIIIATVALPLILATSISQASICQTSDKPSGLYLKGFYDPFIHNNSHTNSLYGAALGYKMGYLRAEGKYGYGERTLGHTNALSLIGYLDWDNSSPISPYVGVGAGEDFNHHAFTLNNNDVHALGTVGARAYLNQNIALDVGYVTALNSTHNLDGTTVGFQGRATVGLVYQF
ncbi:MAG: hypothetical protein H0U75_09025 [Legionella sp.]|nr:hypothetical protein [Legionella sp.]